jgi:hypothetical protein
MAQAGKSAVLAAKAGRWGHAQKATDGEQICSGEIASGRLFFLQKHSIILSSQFYTKVLRRRQNYIKVLRPEKHGSNNTAAAGDELAVEQP